MESNWAPKNTIMGHLSEPEVLVYYDRPLLFSTVNEEGDIFLAIWVTSDGEAKTEKHLYAGLLSETEAEAVMDSKITLRNAFLNWDGRKLYVIDTSWSDYPDGEISTCTPISPIDVPSDWLPPEGFALDTIVPVS